MCNPTVLVVDDEAANRTFIARVLAAAAWTVVEAADGQQAIDAAVAMSPDLVIMDIDMPVIDGWLATKAIRAMGAPVASVPILAYTALPVEDVQIVARGMDARLPKPCTPDALIAAVACWRPGGALAGTQRLIEVFGEDELVGLLTRFRDQLADALIALDRGALPDGSAHRIAGVAGTLGFAEVAATWLRLSEGDAAAADDARRDARLAIAGIDRQWAR